VALLHLLGVLATAWYVAESTDGQAPMVWFFWGIVDLPWSVAYVLFGHGYTIWAQAHYSGHPVLAQLLYLPHWLHGIVGTVWWYFLILWVGKLVNRVRARATSARAPSA
jgi:hypothetical protein